MVLAVVGVALIPASAAASLPTVDYALSGAVGDNGWYVGPVRVNWTVSANAESFDCPAIMTIRDDTAGTTVTCTARNADGTVPATTRVIRIDQAPPINLAAAPARPPDAPPFYTAPVPISWSATDAPSGVASCTTITYAGPDAAAAAPQGACRDRAGNVSAPVALTFAYDATAPALTGVAATAQADGTVALAWSAASDAQTVSVTRQPGDATLADRAPAATTRALTDGPLPPATTYTYTVTARDAAGNATAATTTTTTPKAKTAATATAQGGRTTARHVLRWKRRAGARYYNVQLFRNGRKVLSAWPTGNHYTLRARWRYRGRTHRLVPGRYRWYVWAGYGPRAAHRYGRLLAKGAVDHR
jgi:hypothetical protein